MGGKRVWDGERRYGGLGRWGPGMGGGRERGPGMGGGAPRREGGREGKGALKLAISFNGYISYNGGAKWTYIYFC